MDRKDLITILSYTGLSLLVMVVGIIYREHLTVYFGAGLIVSIVIYTYRKLDRAYKEFREQENKEIKEQGEVFKNLDL